MLLLVSLGSPLFQFTQPGTLTTGLYVVQPLAVVAHPAVGARLHAF